MREVVGVEHFVRGVSIKGTIVFECVWGRPFGRPHMFTVASGPYIRVTLILVVVLSSVTTPGLLLAKVPVGGQTPAPRELTSLAVFLPATGSSSATAPVAALRIARPVMLSVLSP